MVRIALFTLKAILALGVILNVFLSFIGVLKKRKSKGNQLDKIWWLLESQTCRIFGGELMLVNVIHFCCGVYAVVFERPMLEYTCQFLV